VSDDAHGGNPEPPPETRNVDTPSAGPYLVDHGDDQGGWKAELENLHDEPEATIERRPVDDDE
jgi:hypothetical protein